MGGSGFGQYSDGFGGTTPRSNVQSAKNGMLGQSYSPSTASSGQVGDYSGTNFDVNNSMFEQNQPFNPFDEFSNPMEPNVPVSNPNSGDIGWPSPPISNPNPNWGPTGGDGRGPNPSWAPPVSNPNPSGGPPVSNPNPSWGPTGGDGRGPNPSWVPTGGGPPVSNPNPNINPLFRKVLPNGRRRTNK